MDFLTRRASTIYVNIFSGEATTEFPSATQMARGGVSIHKPHSFSVLLPRIGFLKYYQSLTVLSQEEKVIVGYCI